MKTDDDEHTVEIPRGPLPRCVHCGKAGCDEQHTVEIPRG